MYIKPTENDAVFQADIKYIDFVLISLYFAVTWAVNV